MKATFLTRHLWAPVRQCASYWSQHAFALAKTLGAGPVGLTSNRAAAPPPGVGLTSLRADHHLHCTRLFALDSVLQTADGILNLAFDLV
ncbi:MAG TPA: hypothetical protein VFO36_07195, partial [Nitrospiraceae bacterium]|nr:hypothetical protein [Nitrospiraceae bacterium]